MGRTVSKVSVTHVNVCLVQLWADDLLESPQHVVHEGVAWRDEARGPLAQALQELGGLGFHLHALGAWVVHHVCEDRRAFVRQVVVQVRNVAQDQDAAPVRVVAMLDAMLHLLLQLCNDKRSQLAGESRHATSAKK